MTQMFSLILKRLEERAANPGASQGAARLQTI
jgi:hypothetical protein